MLAESALQLFEDVTLEAADLLAFRCDDRCAARDQLLVRPNADEGVPAHTLAAFDRLQQERFRLLRGDAEERGDRRLKIGRNGAVDGDQRVPLLRESEKGLRVGCCGLALRAGHGVGTMVQGRLFRGVLGARTHVSA